MQMLIMLLLGIALFDFATIVWGLFTSEDVPNKYFFEALIEGILSFIAFMADGKFAICFSVVIATLHTLATIYHFKNANSMCFYHVPYSILLIVAIYQYVM